MEKLIQLLESSRVINQVLARVYLKEADQDLLNVLGKLNSADDAESQAAAASVALKKFLANVDADTMDNLAADYAHVFLGAGKKEEKSAYPFESVYTSPQGLIMQDAYEDCVRTYRKYGLSRSQADLYEDHIGMQLDFLAFLDQKAIEAAKTNDTDKVEQFLKEKQDFLNKHVLNWIDGFTSDAQKCSQTDFYKSLAKITEVSVKEQADLLKSLLA